MNIIILGAGGHAKVLAEILENVIGYTDADPALHGKIISGRPVIGDDEAITRHHPMTVRVANGLGSAHSMALRRKVYERWADTFAGPAQNARYRFVEVIHPSAVISKSAIFGAGVQVMAGAIINTRAAIHGNTIINTGAIIEHDCKIGAHCHIAPGATICGGVTIEEAVHVGCGATVIQGVYVGHGSLIAAGAVVVKDVSAGSRVKGVPAEVW